jgi:UPF0148 protein
MALTAELIRRGATILQEPCPRDGSVQIRYKGSVYCTNEDNLGGLLSPGSESGAPTAPAPIKVEEKKPTQQTASSVDSIRKLLEEKMEALSKQLDSTTDIEEQSRILDLISKYLETLEKAKRAAT